MEEIKFQKEQLEFFGTTESGLWLKTVIDPDTFSVSLWWYERVKIEGETVMVLGQSGDTIRKGNARDIEWPIWVEAGRVETPFNQWVEDLGWEQAKSVARGVARLLVKEASLGWGSCLDEVLVWFVDLKERDFLVAGDYVIDSGVGEFEDMDGTRVRVEDPGDGGEFLIFVEVGSSFEELVTNHIEPEMIVASFLLVC